MTSVTSNVIVLYIAVFMLTDNHWKAECHCNKSQGNIIENEIVVLVISMPDVWH